ncbi:MAG: hypothetical protein AAGC46_19440 [Solirubrobacteraceae bacterium]
MAAIDLLALLKTELRVQGSSKDADLQQILDGAVATFAERTGRNLTQPDAGDPETTVVRAIHGGVLRVPDARTVSKLELSPTRLNPSWTTITSFDGHPWKTDASVVWLTVNSFGLTGSYAVARVTGRFGLSPIPLSAANAIVSLAAHRYRARGAEAGAEWSDPAGDMPTVTFRQLPPSYLEAVRAWTVPQRPVSYTQVA